MRKEILLALVVMFGAIAPVFAAEGEFHGAVGYTFDTQYVWRGFSPFGTQTASHPFVDFDLFGTGFGFATTGHFANHSGYVNGERWDYSPYYRNTIGAKDDTFAVDYQLSYVYYNYPKLGQGTTKGNHITADLQELNALLSLPNITGIKGLVPRYCLVKLWSSSQNSATASNNPNGGSANGFAHIFMLEYALPISNVTSEIPQQTLNFHTELVWNDGVDPRPFGGYKSSDWTDFVFGVNTDFNLGSNVTLTPGIYHQITMEDDEQKGVNSHHDITWGNLTVKFRF
jgi:hypothetical protein